MKKMVALLAGAVILTACGGGSDGGSGGTTVTSSVSGLDMPESMSVVAVQNESATSNGAASLMSIVRDVSGFPATSQYNTDQVRSYVYDESMESLSTVNMILCLMEQTRATDMVNKGAYIALVNEDKCEQGENGNQQSTGQSSGAAATEFNNWTILSTRASNDDPQLVKIWVPGNEGGSDPMDAQTILIEVAVSEGVSSTAPFGSFAMNFKGVANLQGIDITTMTGTLKTVANELGQPHFNFINAGGDAVAGNSGMGFSFEESSDVILDEVSGTGGVALTHASFSQTGQGGNFSEASTFAVAFNESYLYRGKDEDDNGVIDGQEAKQCTDRADFNTNVWRYNLYHAADRTFNGKTVTAGQRVELNSGFPFEYDSDDDGINDSYGWVGYHGIWSENENAITDGSTITEFDYENDTTIDHTVHVSNGKLIRRTANTIALSELAGEEFQWWGMHPTLNTDGQWIVTVGSDSSKFNIIAKQSWGDNGPSTSTTVDHDGDANTAPLAVAATITLQDNEWIGFWSEALGGSLDYVYDSNAATPTAKFYGQEFVSPSDAVFASSSVTLYCYERCLKGGIDQAAVDAAAGGNGADDLYYVYGGAPFVYTVAIANGKMVLTDNANNLPVGLVGLTLTNIGHDWGFNTGEMITNALSDPTSPWLILDETVTYSWETGNNEWNRLVTVTDAQGNFTSFDPPMSFNYTHEAVNDANSDTAYVDSKFLLEYGGAGELRGFPWVASKTDTDGNPIGDRWYPAVTLKDGVELTDKDGTVFVIKAIEKEQSMKTVAETNCNAGTNALNIDQLFTQLSLPATSDIGSVSLTKAGKPDVTDAPAVIEGELQE